VPGARAHGRAGSDGRAGASTCPAPIAAAHTFGNAGTGEARLLVLHAPAMDAHFEELHRLRASGEPPATAQERAQMARFGMEQVQVGMEPA